MATHTTYYNLTKPAQNDKVNIGVLNDNADIIDTALHNKVDSSDLTADNVMMSDGVTSVEDGTVQYIGDTLLNTINTYNASWLATANGWCVGYIFSGSDHTATVSIDGVEVARSGGTTAVANVTFPVSFPIKKGQTITTRNTSDTYYNIKVLAMV